MNLTPENVPDETLLQAKVVRAQLLIRTNTRDIVREIRQIHTIDLEIRDNAKWRIQTISTIGYGRSLHRTNIGHFWIPPTNR